MHLHQNFGVFPAGEPQLPTHGDVLPVVAFGHCVHHSCVAGSYIFSFALSQNHVATSELRSTETRTSGRSCLRMRASSISNFSRCE